MKTKECYRCKTEKPLEEFTKVAKNKDGLNIWCKPCVKERNAEKAAAKLAGQMPDPKTIKDLPIELTPFLPPKRRSAVEKSREAQARLAAKREPDSPDPAHIGPRRSTRAPLTPEQKEARNRQARERRAAKKAS